MTHLALFDLDHTLLSGDSDVLWCEFLMQQGLLPRAEFEARNASMAQRYRQGSVSAAEFCDFYVSTLAGRTPAECSPGVNASCIRWWCRLFPSPPMRCWTLTASVGTCWC